MSNIIKQLEVHVREIKSELAGALQPQAAGMHGISYELLISNLRENLAYAEAQLAHELRAAANRVAKAKQKANEQFAQEQEFSLEARARLVLKHPAHA